MEDVSDSKKKAIGAGLGFGFNVESSVAREREID